MPGDLVVAAAGLGLQPVVTLSAPLSCVFFPTPDLVFVLQFPGSPATTASIPLPRSLRPVSFHVQALSLSMQGLVTTTDARRVDAF